MEKKRYVAIEDEDMSTVSLVDDDTQTNIPWYKRFWTHKNGFFFNLGLVITTIVLLATVAFPPLTAFFIVMLVISAVGVFLNGSPLLESEKENNSKDILTISQEKKDEEKDEDDDDDTLLSISSISSLSKGKENEGLTSPEKSVEDSDSSQTSDNGVKQGLMESEEKYDDKDEESLWWEIDKANKKYNDLLSQKDLLSSQHQQLSQQLSPHPLGEDNKLQLWQQIICHSNLYKWHLHLWQQREAILGKLLKLKSDLAHIQVKIISLDQQRNPLQNQVIASIIEQLTHKEGPSTTQLRRHSYTGECMTSTMALGSKDGPAKDEEKDDVQPPLIIEQDDSGCVQLREEESEKSLLEKIDKINRNHADLLSQQDQLCQQHRQLWQNPGLRKLKLLNQQQGALLEQIRNSNRNKRKQHLALWQQRDANNTEMKIPEQQLLDLEHQLAQIDVKKTGLRQTRKKLKNRVVRVLIKQQPVLTKSRSVSDLSSISNLGQWGNRSASGDEHQSDHHDSTASPPPSPELIVSKFYM